MKNFIFVAILLASLIGCDRLCSCKNGVLCEGNSCRQCDCKVVCECGKLDRFKDIR